MLAVLQAGLRDPSLGPLLRLSRGCGRAPARRGHDRRERRGELDPRSQFHSRFHRRHFALTIFAHLYWSREVHSRVETVHRGAWGSLEELKVQEEG